MKRSVLSIIILTLCVLGCTQRTQTTSNALLTADEAISIFAEYDTALTKAIEANAPDCEKLGAALLPLIQSREADLDRAFRYMNALSPYSDEETAFRERYEAARPSRVSHDLMKSIDVCGKTPQIRQFKQVYSKVMLGSIVQ